MRNIKWPIRLHGALCLLVALAVHAASAPEASAPGPRAQVSVLTGGQVIRILDDTVEWYRALGTQQQNATQPSDLLILYANRQTADKVVSLAFDMARANAELLSSEASVAAAADSSTASESLTQKQAQLAAEHQSVQQEIATDRQQLASAGRGRQDLEAKVAELQGELAMASICPFRAFALAALGSLSCTNSVMVSSRFLRASTIASSPCSSATFASRS